jgi:hypothetical protein
LVSDKGGRKGFVYKARQNVYRALRRQGKSESTAAAIANEGNSRSGRSTMARKAAKTRKRRGK